MSVLVFLAHGDRAQRWWRPADDAHGEGEAPAADRVVAVAPAEAVTLHWAPIPARTPAQAIAAARLLVADTAAAAGGDLHLAVGAADADGQRPIGVVAAGIVADWLAVLAEQGVDPDAIVPAPLLLPAPGDAFLGGTLGGAGVVRGPGVGLADEAGLTPLVTGGATVERVEGEALRDAVAAAMASPPLDLRVAGFARRRRLQVDWGSVRRLARLAALALALVFATDLVRLVRLNHAAAAAEGAADALAAGALPRGQVLFDPARQLSEAVVAARGPGRGFSATAAAVYAALARVPGSELTAMAFGPDGAMTVSLATRREGEPTELKRAIEAMGFAVQAGVFQAANGRVAGRFVVTPAAGGGR